MSLPDKVTTLDELRAIAMRLPTSLLITTIIDPGDILDDLIPADLSREERLLRAWDAMGVLRAEIDARIPARIVDEELVAAIERSAREQIPTL